MDWLLPLVCVGVLFVLPLVFTIIALVQNSALRGELRRLVKRLELLEGMYSRLNYQVATRESPAPTPATRPSVQPPAAPQPAPASPVVPIAAPVATAPPPVAPPKPIEAPRAIDIPAPPVAPVAPLPAPPKPAFTPPPPVPAMPVTPTPVAAVPPITPPPLPPRPPVVIHVPKPAPPKQKLGLEFFLGTKVLVAVGAVALAFAGIFLVKLAVDKNFFNPAIRCMLGALCGLALLAVAQWRRKQETFIAQGLSAAGVVALFAATFAATSLYHFLPGQVGFLLLALVTALAVALSLQKPGGGPLIASLGLIGGFVTPVLVRTENPNIPGLFGYLFLLHVGLVTVTRYRGWAILAACTIAASNLWLLLWLIFSPWNPEHAPVLGLFMLASVFTSILSTAQAPEPWGRFHRDRGTIAATALTWFSASLALIAACLLLSRSEFSNLEWAWFGLLLAGGFILARLRPRYEGIAWAAAIAVLVMLMSWSDVEHQNLKDLAEVLRLRNLLFLFGLGTTLAAYACSWGSRLPARWLTLTSFSALAYVVVTYFYLGTPVRPDEWAYLPLAAAALLLLLAIPIYFRRATLRTAEESLGLLTHTILALLVIAPPMALTDGRLSAAWAALLPVVAFSLYRLRLPTLMFGFLGLFLLNVLRGFALKPVIDAGPGPSLFWNPVIWTYGSILLGMLIALPFIERAKSLDLPDSMAGFIPSAESLAGLLQVVCAAAAFALMTLLVHWHFHNGKLDDLTAPFAERGAWAVGGLFLSAALLFLGYSLKRDVLLRCGEIATTLASIYALAALIVFGNPLFTGDHVGSMPVVNILLYVYGTSAALCAACAYLLRRANTPAPNILQFTAVSGFLLTFTLITLLVRQGFAGDQLNVGDVTFTEWATYPIAWLFLAAACYAIARPLIASAPSVASTPGVRLPIGALLFTGAGTIFAVIAVLFAILIPGAAASPILHPENVGNWPILNRLLYAYGTPILLSLAVLYLAPRHLLTDARFHLSRFLKVAALILGFILVTTEVRQFFQGATLNRPDFPFLEHATYPLAWLLLAAPFLYYGRRFNLLIPRTAAFLLIALALVFALVMNGFFASPLFLHDAVGSIWIFNWLLYAYALPALAATLIAMFLWDLPGNDELFSRLAAAASLLLIFLVVSLEVRQFFHGTFIDFPFAGQPTTSEMAAYSFAWGTLGILFLIAGILRENAFLRWASLVLMTVTIFKVFLLDLIHLRDLGRVLSFAGLGLSLMALGFIYLHFVFKKPAPSTEPSPDSITPA